MGNNTSSQSVRRLDIRSHKAASPSNIQHVEYADTDSHQQMSSESDGNEQQHRVPRLSNSTYDQSVKSSTTTSTQYHSPNPVIAPHSDQNQHENNLQRMTNQLNEINATGRASKPTTPNIFLDDLVDNDYFSKPGQGFENIRPGDASLDAEFDDGYNGIDDDLTTGSIPDQRSPKQVLIKYYDSRMTLGPKDSIYVVGSFNGWSKKIKLEPEFHANGDLKSFKTLITLPLGVYRAKFIVNNEIKYSEALPIATDKSGNVVNWFEVDNLPEDTVEAGIVESNKIHNNKRKSSVSFFDDSHSSTNKGINTHSNLMTPQPSEKTNYSQEIPETFQAVYNTDEILPIDESFLHRNPIPDLPVYLNNNYLNKHFNIHHGNNSSDAEINLPRGSVKGLNSHIIPHVNLNHLLTSNIKNNVLAVACTTRYSGKFVTQIMFSPSDYDV